MFQRWMTLTFLLTCLTTGCSSLRTEPDELITPSSEWGTNITARTIYNEVIDLLSEGRQIDAENLVAEGCARCPDSQRLFFLRGVLERSRFDKAEAFRFFAEAYGLGNSNSLGAVCLTVSSMDKGLGSLQGFEVLRTVINEHPDEILFRWLFAIECREYRVYAEEAAEQYEYILNQWPIGPVLVHHTYANILTESLDRPDDALEHRLIASELEPKSWTYQGLANTAKALKDYDRASEIFAKICLEMAPEQPRFWQQWGITLCRAEDFSGASEKFKKASALNPDDSASVMFLGYSQQAQGQLEAGYTNYVTAIEMDPKFRIAASYLTLLTFFGYGTTPDLYQAVDYGYILHRRTLKQPCPILQAALRVHEGTQVMGLNPEDVLLPHLQALAEEGDPAAQFNMGVVYKYGLCVPKNGLTAIQWFKQSLDGGNIAAAEWIATLYNAGSKFLDKDPAMATKYYEIGAVGGDAFCMRVLGNRHLTGEGVTPSLDKAIKWLDRSAQEGEGGYPYLLLGNVLRTGNRYFHKDWEAAAHWYQKGVDAGDVSCLNFLAMMHENGGENLPRDIGKAIELYEQAWAEEPNTFGAARNLIVLYCKVDDPAYRDPKKAVEIALDAVTKNPKNNFCLEYLAMAYAYDGQFDKAVNTIESAIRMERSKKRREELGTYCLNAYKEGRVE